MSRPLIGLELKLIQNLYLAVGGVIKKPSTETLHPIINIMQFFFTFAKSEVSDIFLRIDFDGTLRGFRRRRKCAID